MSSLTNFSEKSLNYFNRAIRGLLYATFRTVENWGKKGADCIVHDAEMQRKSNVLKK